ncbi:hypothetical protein AB0L40_26985, partial [Patulibacter sp. NPDC049589]
MLAGRRQREALHDRGDRLGLGRQQGAGRAGELGETGDRATGQQRGSRPDQEQRGAQRIVGLRAAGLGLEDGRGLVGVALLQQGGAALLDGLRPQRGVVGLLQQLVEQSQRPRGAARVARGDRGRQDPAPWSVGCSASWREAWSSTTPTGT